MNFMSTHKFRVFSHRTGNTETQKDVMILVVIRRPFQARNIDFDLLAGATV
jgi:hypothetical protein